MQELAILAAIDKLVASRPELAELASRLDTSDNRVRLTPEFLAAYSQSAITPTARALLLRVLFGDPSVFRAPIIDRFTPALAGRVLTYLEGMPSDPLRSGTCLHHELPKPLLRLFGLRDVGFRELADALLLLVWDRALGRAPAASANALAGVADPDCVDVLLPVLERRLLTDASAGQLAAEGLSAAAAAYYFDSSVDAINVRNQLLYCAKILDGDRDGGRAQNKVPLQLSRRFGITPRSIPDTLVLMDVLALAHHGLVTPPTPDALRLAGLFSQPVPGGRDFWKPAIAPHAERPLLHLGASTELDESSGVFDTSLRFNLSRATGLIEGRRARLAAFAPYYATLHAHPFAAHCKRYWDPISRNLARRTGALATDPMFNSPALRIRDIGNILALSELLPPAALYLPSVAKFALGTPEPVPTGKGKSFQRSAAGKERKPDAGAVTLLHARLDAQSVSTLSTD